VASLKSTAAMVTCWLIPSVPFPSADSEAGDALIFLLVGYGEIRRASQDFSFAGKNENNPNRPGGDSLFWDVGYCWVRITGFA